LKQTSLTRNAFLSNGTTETSVSISTAGVVTTEYGAARVNTAYPLNISYSLI